VTSDRLPPAPPRRVLLVDDEETLRERLARALRHRGYEVWTASSVHTALGLLHERPPPDAALVDLRMPGTSGLELLRELKRLYPGLHVVIMTGFGSIPTAVEATRLGAADFLQKPVNTEEVLAALEGHRDRTRPTSVEVPSLASAEWEHIQRVLADCGGNVTEAARRLGIDRRSLQRKLRRYAPLK